MVNILRARTEMVPAKAFFPQIALNEPPKAEVRAFKPGTSFGREAAVVVFDRVRENRGKFGHLDRQVLNDSINQTLSRTLLTGSTTIVTILVMYVFGGPGIHGFTFALLVGILVGTYSSIAVASPLLLLGLRQAQATRMRDTSVGRGQLQRA